MAMVVAMARFAGRQGATRSLSEAVARRCAPVFGVSHGNHTRDAPVVKTGCWELRRPFATASLMSVGMSETDPASHAAVLKASTMRHASREPRRRFSSTSVIPREQCAAAELDRTTNLKPAHFFGLLQSHGTTFFTGAPESLLKDFRAHITDTLHPEDHVTAVDDGMALALAARHHKTTGKIPCVYLQNSALGAYLNPMLSVCSPRVYSIPSLLLIGWQDDLPAFLKEMGLPYDVLPGKDGAFEVVEKAYAHVMQTRQPFALLVEKDTFAPTTSFMEESFMDRFEHGQNEATLLDRLHNRYSVNRCRAMA